MDEAVWSTRGLSFATLTILVCFENDGLVLVSLTDGDVSERWVGATTVFAQQSMRWTETDTGRLNGSWDKQCPRSGEIFPRLEQAGGKCIIIKGRGPLGKDLEKGWHGQECDCRRKHHTTISSALGLVWHMRQAWTSQTTEGEIEAIQKR